MDFLQTLEGAFFFAVPLLCLGIWGGRRAMRSRPRRIAGWVLLFVAVYSVPVLLGGCTVSRYFMPLALLVSLFAGAGLKGISELPGVRRFSRLVMIGITAIVCLATAFKLLSGGNKAFIRDFAGFLKDKAARPVLLLGMEAPDCLKIAARFNAAGPAIPIQAVSCESWPEIVETQLLAPEAAGREIYVLLRSRRETPWAELVMDFRTRYYSFPFEIVQSAVYRKARYWLLHYDARVGDGRRNLDRRKILESLPASLPLAKKRTFYTQDLAVWIPDALRAEDDYVIGVCEWFSASEHCSWHFRDKGGAKPEEVALTYWNSLYWPVASRKVHLAYPEKELPESRPVQVDPDDFPAIAASQAAPLYPSAVTLYGGAETRLDYHWREAAPGEGATPRLKAALRNGGAAVLEDGVVHIPPETTSLELVLSDELLHTETAVPIEVRRAPAAKLPAPGIRVALIGTGDFARETAQALQKILPDSQIDFFLLDEGIPINDVSRRKAEAQIAGWRITGRYDYLIFEPILKNSAAQWNFWYNSADFEEFFPPLWKKIQSRISARHAAWLIPPAPTGKKMVLAANARQARMSHFRLGWLLRRYAGKLHAAGQPEPDYLTLTGCSDPVQDIQIQAGKRTEYSCLYRPSGFRKFAEQIGWYLLVTQAADTPKNVK